MKLKYVGISNLLPLIYNPCAAIGLAVLFTIVGEPIVITLLVVSDE